MTQPPETILVETHRVSCDGASAIRGGAGYRPAALGHPRVWLAVPHDTGWVECGYCDKRFEIDRAHAHDDH